MNSEFEVFKKSLETVDSIPSLTGESIELYLSEIELHSDGGSLKPTILIIDEILKLENHSKPPLGKNTI
ncbi:MAG: hypothetical protein IPO06_08630 [Leptospiraceae bacterium]|nr:hypothetical protein [Leptospiraceae bacterium]